MTKNERIVYLAQKNEVEGGLKVEELKELNALIAEQLDAAQVSASEVKGSNGVVSEEKAGLLSRAWSCTVSVAKKVWNWIWKFFAAIFGFVGKGFSKVAGWFKKSEKPVAAKGDPKTIDISAQKAA